MSLNGLSYQKLSELQTERVDVVLAFCNEMQTTRLTPEQEQVLKPKFDAANAALAEVNAELKKRRAEMQVPARSGRRGW